MHIYTHIHTYIYTFRFAAYRTDSAILAPSTSHRAHGRVPLAPCTLHCPPCTVNLAPSLSYAHTPSKLRPENKT